MRRLEFPRLRPLSPRIGIPALDLDLTAAASLCHSAAACCCCSILKVSPHRLVHSRSLHSAWVIILRKRRSLVPAMATMAAAAVHSHGLLRCPSVSASRFASSSTSSSR